MSKKIRTEAVDSLFEAILSLQDKEECYAFFEDVCTVNELLSLSQRFEVAKMLREKRTYLEIAEKTGASTATISRVMTVTKWCLTEWANKRQKELYGPCQKTRTVRLLFFLQKIGCRQLVDQTFDHLLFQVDIETQHADKRELP